MIPMGIGCGSASARLQILDLVCEEEQPESDDPRPVANTGAELNDGKV